MNLHPKPGRRAAAAGGRSGGSGGRYITGPVLHVNGERVIP